MKSKRTTRSKRPSKKPITLLTKIESLLDDVLVELSSIEKSVERNVRELLQAAAASVSKAKDFIVPVLASAGPPARSKRAVGRPRRKISRRAAR